MHHGKATHRSLLQSATPSKGCSHGASFFSSSRQQSSRAAEERGRMRAKERVSFCEQQNNPEIYLSRVKRRAYMKQVVDHYFTTQPARLQPHTNVQARKQVYSSEGNNSRHHKHNTHKDGIGFRSMEIDTVGLIGQMQPLPTITQTSLRSRPRTTHRPSNTDNLHQPPSLLILEDSELLHSENSQSIIESKLFREGSTSGLSGSGLRDRKTMARSQRSTRTGFRMVQQFGESWLQQQQLLRLRIVQSRLPQTLLLGQLKGQDISYPSSAYQSLRQLYFETRSTTQDNQPLHLISPTKQYRALFSNGCEGLKDLLRAIAQIIQKAGPQLANCKVTLNNIVKVEEKVFLLRDWGSSAVRQQIDIRGQSIVRDYPPLVQQAETGKWLTPPQYLAPELVACLATDSFSNVFSQRGGLSVCDIWSLGCLLFELLSCFPLQKWDYCVMRGTGKARRGFLGIKGKVQLERVYQKQRQVKGKVRRWLKEHVEVEEWLGQLVLGMLQQSAEQRLNVEQVLARLP